MGKKKLQHDTVPAPSSIFSSLFGGVTDENTAIFSDNNPFKRKHQDSQSGSEPAVNPKNSDSSNSNTAKPKKAKNKKEEKPNLDLRVEEGIQTPQKPNLNDQELKGEGSEKRKRKKRKRDEVEREYEEKKYGAKAEEEVEKVVVGVKRKKAENETEDMLATSKDEGFDDENKLLRTVFVGNLPLKVKKKLLLKEFSKFGEVESIRIRSVPILDVSVMWYNSSRCGFLMEDLECFALCVSLFCLMMCFCCLFA